MSDKNRMEELLEKNIKSLRQNLDELTIDKFIGKTIETLMLIERDEFLEVTSEKDKGNGSYSRSLNSLSKNSLLVHIPRTRTGLFSPATLELLKINREKVDEIALSLYKKGMTSNDINEFLNEVFEKNMSPAKISNLAKVFNKFRVAWKNSKLEKTYKVVYGDVIFITVRRDDEYAKEGIFIAFGVREDNRRELLCLSQNPTESAEFWKSILQDLKEKRGVEKIDLFVADGLKNLENIFLEIYPQGEFQKCVVHKQRNILNKTRPKDKKEIAEDLKELFNNFEENDTIEKAFKKKDNFIEKWKTKYPDFKNYFKEIDYYFTYIKFDPKVRRMIYTTNSIENLNRQIRKTTRNKLSFESPERLLDYVFMVIKEFEEKNYMKYPVTNFKYFGKLN